MRMRFIGLAAVVVMCLAAGEVQSPAVRSIENRREAAIAQAKKVYQASVMAAEKQCLADYQVSIAAANKAGNVEAVTALVLAKREAEARYTQTSQGTNTEVSEFPLAGSEWLCGGVVVTYRRDGTVYATAWNTPQPYKVLDSRTVVQREPDGQTVTVTFAADGRAAMWVYESGKIATVTRK